MLKILADVGRLFLLVLFLPLFIFFMGPLLILAVLRGRQWAGPVTLNTSRYGAAGRLGALVLGLLLWGLTWGGLAWLAVPTVTVPPAIASIVLTFTSPPAPDPTPASTRPPAAPVAAAASTATPTPSPSPTALVDLRDPVSPTPSGLRPPAAQTAAPLPSPAESSATPTRPPASPTPTEVRATGLPAAAGQPALASEEEAAVAAITEGNLLLHQAVLSPVEVNLQKLETVWRGQALSVARAFVSEVNERYDRPLEVEFDYVSPPTIKIADVTNVITVVIRENWRYQAPNQSKNESFEFTYTLFQEDGTWVITNYTFRNLNREAPTPTPAAAPGFSSPVASATPGADVSTDG